MSINLDNKDLSKPKKWKTINFKVDEDDFDKTVEKLSNIAANTLNSSGKLGASYAEVILQLLDNHVSNIDLKDFISRDFYEQSSAINRRIDDLTDAVNTLTLTVENLRNVFALMSTSGDINGALTLINNMSNRALIEQKSGANDFEFTTTNRAEIEREDDSLIAAFEQIKVSEPSDKSTAFGAGFVTNFGTLKESKGGADKNLDWFYVTMPRLFRYSIGLRAPSDILIRFSLYHRM
ncbi:hypothetical protein ACNSPG_22425 (plasmid) [Brucella pituitosa]|uniref:hypothetical protein n=1 Tax=Brucella pituitosa TaxID=571256 RepID=UPI003C7467FB